jgi:hypothetical protein
MPNTEISAETMEQCFNELLPELLAIPENEVKKPRVNIPAVSALMFAAVARLVPYQEEMARRFPEEAPIVNSLRKRAFAMMHAYLDATMAEPVRADVLELAAQAGPLRLRLLRAAELLVVEGEVTEEAVAAIREGSGYLDLATDLLRLEKLLSAREKAVEQNTPKIKVLLPEAARLGAVLMEAIGVRELPKDGAPQVVQIRDRGYTYFTDALEEARSQLAYIRRKQNDVDAILPNIFSNRRTTPSPIEGAEPAPSPGGTTGTNGNGSAKPAPAPTHDVDPDSPFIS